jgi:hypothetical protein
VNDMQRELDELGRRLWPRSDVLRPARTRRGASRGIPGKRGRGLNLLAAVAVVAVVVAILAVPILVGRFHSRHTTSAVQPSAVSSPTPTSSPPPGGPVPSQLWGNWYLPGAAVTQVTAGTIHCPSNPTPTNCFFQLMLGGSTWSISYAALGGIYVPSQGNVAANRNEMDFYNSAYCDFPEAGGLGRYTWRLTAGVLYFTLISDTCSRALVLTNRGWARTLVAGQPGG